MLSLTLIFCLNFPRLYFMQFRKKHAIFCCHVLRSNNSIRPRILYIILYNIDVVICLKLLAEIGISLRTNMILFCWFILFMTGRNNYFHSEESVSAATLKTNGTGRNPQMSPTYGPRPTQRWAGGSSFTSSFYLYIKGAPSIPETYLSSSVAWGLNLRVGWWRQIVKNVSLVTGFRLDQPPHNGRWCNYVTRTRVTKLTFF